MYCPTCETNTSAGEQAGMLGEENLPVEGQPKKTTIARQKIVPSMPAIKSRKQRYITKYNQI